MKIVVAGEYKTSVGDYLLLRERHPGPDVTSTKMYEDELFFFPRNCFDELRLGRDVHADDLGENIEYDGDVLKPFALPKTAKTSPGIRTSRLMKFILQHFYRILEKEYMSFDKFSKIDIIQAAMEVHHQLSLANSSPFAWLSRNHYQYVSKHNDLKVPSVRNTWLGPFSYTQIRTYYPREGIVLCQWKLGDDGVDEIVVHDEEDGGKRIVNPILTLDVHRHYTKERIQTLQQIVEEKRITPPSEHSALSVLIRSFYMTRRAESIINRHSLD